MKKRIIAILLVLCMCFSLVPAVGAEEPTLQSTIDMDKLVEHGISMFKALEAGGRYDTVVNTSVGCVGMGIMGWINSAALQLLRWCGTESKGGDPEYCKSILGEELFNEVMNAPIPSWCTNDLIPLWGYWGDREFTDEELAAASKLLGSELGIRVQHNLAKLYITREAQNGWDAGVRTEAALLYYCSAENHYGAYGVQSFMSAVRTALHYGTNTQITSLEAFHLGTKLGAQAGTVSTYDYRTRVYHYIKDTLQLPTGVPFTDLPSEDHWAYDAIIWAYTTPSRVTAGTTTTTFSPDLILDRAQAVTFLWAAAGRPTPTSNVNPFEDVSEGDWFYTPVLWAVEHHYTAGTTATTFSPEITVTTSQMLTFLWALAGRPSAGSGGNPFQDVSSGDWFYTPVLWASHAGLLVGNEGHGKLLEPDTPCSRAYVVTYLFHYFMNAEH